MIEVRWRRGRKRGNGNEMSGSLKDGWAAPRREPNWGEITCFCLLFEQLQDLLLLEIISHDLYQQDGNFCMKDMSILKNSQIHIQSAKCAPDPTILQQNGLTSNGTASHIVQENRYKLPVTKNIVTILNSLIILHIFAGQLNVPHRSFNQCHLEVPT